MSGPQARIDAKQEAYTKALEEYKAAMAELEANKKGAKKGAKNSKKGKDQPSMPMPQPPAEPEPEPELQEPETEGLALVAALLEPVLGCYVFDLEVGTVAMHSDKVNGFALSSSGQPRVFPEPEPEPETLGDKGSEGNQGGETEADADNLAEGARSAEVSTIMPAAGLSKPAVAASADTGIANAAATSDEETAMPESGDPAAKQAETPQLPVFFSHPVVQSKEEADVPWKGVEPTAPAVLPRLFVVYGSGDGYELLSKPRIDDYLAERQKDNTSVVISLTSHPLGAL